MYVDTKYIYCMYICTYTQLISSQIYSIKLQLFQSNFVFLKCVLSSHLQYSFLEVSNDQTEPTFRALRPWVTSLSNHYFSLAFDISQHPMLFTYLCFNSLFLKFICMTEIIRHKNVYSEDQTSSDLASGHSRVATVIFSFMYQSTHNLSSFVCKYSRMLYAFCPLSFMCKLFSVMQVDLIHFVATDFQHISVPIIIYLM